MEPDQPAAGPSTARPQTTTETVSLDVDDLPPPPPPPRADPVPADAADAPRSAAVTPARPRAGTASTVNASFLTDGVEMTPEEGGKGQRKPKPKRHMDDEQGRVSVNSKKGHSVLPTARITKIIKADEDIGIASKEAVFLISLATEHFIRKLMLASYTEARLERRVAVRYNDVARAVSNHDHFFYLADVVPPTLTAAEARRKLAFATTAGQDDTSPALPQPATFPSSSSSMPPPDHVASPQGGQNGDLAAANGLSAAKEGPTAWQPMDVDPARSSSDEDLP